MSEVILSPGVFQIESDQSLYTQAPPALGAAIVGPTVGGRPMVPTYVTTFSQYLSIFGDVFKSGSYYYEYLTSMAAKEYFNNGGQSLLVTRIISGSSNISTYAQTAVPNTAATSAGTAASASWTAVTGDIQAWYQTVINATTPYGVVSYNIINNPYIIYSAGTPNNYAGGANTIYLGTGDGAGNTITSTAQWAGAVAYAINNATAIGATGIGSSFTASAATGLLSISSKLTGTAANAYSVTHSYNYYNVPGTAIQFAGGVDSIAGTSFTLETLTWGDQMNNTSSLSSGSLSSGSAYNVRWEVTNANTGSNGGTFTIVVRRGDDNDAQKNILETWANVSLDPQLPNYISRVIGDLKPVYNVTTNQVEYQGTYANQSQYIRVASVTAPNVDSINNNGKFKSSLYGTTLPAVGSGSYGGSFSGGAADTNLPKLMNENIGNGISTSANIQGFMPADYTEAFQLLVNKDEYQFNVLLTPGLGLDTSVANDMIATVESRGDAIAIVDNGVYGTTITGATQNAAGNSSNYAATYYPWVQLYSSNLGKAVWCPPSTVIGGVLAFNDQVGAEWFAPAGLNRGGIPSVLRAERRLSQTDRDTLYTQNVNPLATFPGTGVCVWGQKTLQNKPTSLDRVNVRRLLIALKDYIGNVSRTLVFEQNTTVTRNRFLSQVNPYLSSVVQRQGLYAYKVVMDETNNTPDVVDRNQLVGQIYIQPTKTAEFIILNFNILPTGATFPA
jgi:hypothetical protein